jgi:dipeptidyl-peptidase-4
MQTDELTAQPLRERYEVAERLLPCHWKNLVFSNTVNPIWTGDDDRFWYRKTTSAGTEFILVDPDAGTRGPAFDHGMVAAAFSSALGRVVSSHELPIRGLELREGEPLRLHSVGQVWLCDSSAVTLASEPPLELHESISPDGRWTVFVRDHNLVVRERASGEERPLTHDGVEGHSIGTLLESSPIGLKFDLDGLRMPPMLAWSPDSRQVVTHRFDEREVPFMAYVQSSPPDGSRPRVHRQRYAMVGEDVVPTVEFMVIDVESGRITRADSAPFPIQWYFSPFTLNTVWWDPSGTSIYFISGDRGDRTVQLSALDPNSGTVRTLVTETSDTQVQTRPDVAGVPNIRVLQTGEVIWWSERTGWGHLYLYNDGSVRALTSGEWLVRDLISVDEEERVAVFSASGREVGLDPYVRQLYWVGLDDAKVERITHDALDHGAIGAPSGRSLVDNRSWIDIPDRSVVLSKSGTTMLELDETDADLLYQAGWSPPERFTVKAADGATDLYGLLYRPHDFDSHESYPVLDSIYPGPQINAASIRFAERWANELTLAPVMAALGFAVVVIDGRGTPLRGKAFQEHCRGAAYGENLDDHVAAIRQLAVAHPWLDSDRVGIYGSSGGGRTSTQAILRHPNFFKVAVSLSGNHDDAFFHAFWGEKTIGPPNDTDYPARANTTHASRLQGKLLLIHGELDIIVPPSLSLRLVDALIAANKDFDLLIVPNADHSVVVNHPYSLRRMWDYFVRFLLDEEPPTYEIADVSVDYAALTWDYFGRYFLGRESPGSDIPLDFESLSEVISA